MRCYVGLVSVVLGGASAGCLDGPAEGPAPLARLVAGWDPLACGEPHRIVVELADEAGAMCSASAPCNLGGLTVDVGHFGSYRGRIYAWALDASIRSITPIELTIDQPIVDWYVATPP